MNKYGAHLSLLLTGAVLMGMGWGLWGCEQAKDINGIDLEPAYIELAGGSNVVNFAATPSGALSLPFAWSVSDPTLGGILTHSGSNAVYVRSAKVGDNVVTVRDQYDVTGSAIVSQR